MFGLGAPELLIIGGIVILLFGVGKVSGLGRELGSSIKEFRKAVKDEEAEKQVQTPPVQQAQTQQPAPPPAQAQQQPPAQPPVDKTPNVF